MKWRGEHFVNILIFKRIVPSINFIIEFYFIFLIFYSNTKSHLKLFLCPKPKYTNEFFQLSLLLLLF